MDTYEYQTQTCSHEFSLVDMKMCVTCSTNVHISDSVPRLWTLTKVKQIPCFCSHNSPLQAFYTTRVCLSLDYVSWWQNKMNNFYRQTIILASWSEVDYAKLHEHAAPISAHITLQFFRQGTLKMQILSNVWRTTATTVSPQWSLATSLPQCLPTPANPGVLPCPFERL